MSTETKHLHFVTVEHERDADGEITVSSMRFECRGTIDSPCHLYPDDVGNFDDVPREQWTEHTDCWLQVWFSIGDLDVTPYDAGDGLSHDLHSIPAHSGPIEHEYDECILWHWIDSPIATEREAS